MAKQALLIPSEEIERVLQNNDLKHQGREIVSKLEELFRQELVLAGVVTEEHFFDLKDVLVVNKHVAESTARPGLVNIDPTRIQGYLPYVEEHGMALSREDEDAYALIEKMETITDRILDAIELQSETAQKVQQLRYEFDNFYQLIKEVAGKKSLDASKETEIRSAIEAAVRYLAEYRKEHEPSGESMNR